MGEYRKIAMDVDSLWEIYRKDFEPVEGGFMREDKESGLDFIYPEEFYKLLDGGVLKPDYMREDNNGLMKRAVCGEYEGVVEGSFTYACGTYQEIDGRKQFVFSFDTEKCLDDCLPNALVRYYWNKRTSVNAAPLPEEIVSDVGILYECSHESDYDYDGVQYFVLANMDLWRRTAITDYYSNLGRLINSANADLDNFDRWKGTWRKAFEQVARPAVESLSGNTVEMTDDEMVATFESTYRKIINYYRYDIVGWRKFMADPDYGPRVPEETLDEDGLPICIIDEICP